MYTTNYCRRRSSTGGDHERFEPTADAGEYESTVLSSDEVSVAFGENRFRNVHSSFGNLALPKGTTMTIRRPTETPHVDGQIRFKNRLCELVIESSFSSGMAGLGSYALLMGVPQQGAQQKYASTHYIVKAHASFTRYLIGNPAMAAHREWAEGIINGLVRAFSEELMYKRATESFLLHAHVPTSIPSPPMPTGPVRSVPAPATNPAPATPKATP